MKAYIVVLILSLSCLGTDMSVTRNGPKVAAVELCVEVVPSSAEIIVRGEKFENGNCLVVHQSLVRVEAQGNGYLPYSEDVEIMPLKGQIKHVITLEKKVDTTDGATPSSKGSTEK
jgi:hypothetical protein